MMTIMSLSLLPSIAPPDMQDEKREGQCVHTVSPPHLHLLMIHMQKNSNRADNDNIVIIAPMAPPRYAEGGRDNAHTQ